MAATEEAGEEVKVWGRVEKREGNALIRCPGVKVLGFLRAGSAGTG